MPQKSTSSQSLVKPIHKLKQVAFTDVTCRGETMASLHSLHTPFALMATKRTKLKVAAEVSI